MSSQELILIQKILDFKEKKSEYIFYQKYANAADARDNERVYEWKLLNVLGYQMSDESVDREEILQKYFIKEFGIDYPKKTTSQFKKNILRQIKLNELGI